MDIQCLAKHPFSAKQKRHLHAPHPITNKSGVARMKSTLSVGTSQAMSLTIGSGPNANSKRWLSSYETGIVLNSELHRLHKLDLTFKLWKRGKGDSDDDSYDFSNRDWRSHRSGRGCVHGPIAQEQGADPTWRGQKAPPVGVQELNKERLGYAVRVLFEKVPQIFCRAIFAANADDQYVASIYIHDLVKLRLSRVLGDARTSYKQYAGGNQCMTITET